MSVMKYRIFAVFAIFAMSCAAQAQPGGNPPQRVVNGITYRVHVVAKGDNLYKISKTYGCTVDELKKANNNKENLKVGEELLVPAGKQASGSGAAVAVAEPSTGIHVVAKGETLYKIAVKYGTTAVELRKLNNLKSDALKIGQKIKVPVAKTPEVRETPRPTETRDTAAKAPAKTNQLPRKQEEKPREETNPAIPEKPKYQPAEAISEKEETGVAKVVSGKMEDTRSHVMHPTLPKGSIIVVINAANGRMAYCKVVDNYASSEFANTGIVLTPAVSEKIGLQGGVGDVKIRYAAP